MIERFGAKLKLDDAAIDGFIACEKVCGKVSGVKSRVFRQLARDTATLISDVHHYTLLELVRLRDFRADSRWIARVLDISVDEVNIMISRLIRLGLLEMTSNNQWTDKFGDTIASIDDFNNVAIQRLAEQLFRSFRNNAASKEYANEANGYCHLNSTIVAVESSAMQSVMSLIAKFELDLAELLSSSQNADEIYQIELNLFPVTNLKNAKEQ